MSTETIKFTDYPGIDYGHAMTNIDENSVRYGVIPSNGVDYWHDESEPIYCDNCPHCGNKLYKEDMDEIDEQEEGECPHCRERLTTQHVWDNAEPLGYQYDKDGYFIVSIECDLFIQKSPYYTYAQFCSPCAPGACYLLTPLNSKHSGNKCYCLGPEWFDGNPPYPIYKF